MRNVHTIDTTDKTRSTLRAELLFMYAGMDAEVRRFIHTMSRDLYAYRTDGAAMVLGLDNTPSNDRVLPEFDFGPGACSDCGGLPCDCYEPEVESWR